MLLPVVILALAACVMPACARHEAPRSTDTARPAQAAPLATATPRASPYDTSALSMVAARGLAGCYSLTVGTWSNSRANGGYLPSPARVDLDTTGLDGARPGFQLAVNRPGFAPPRPMRSWSTWSPVGRDSLQVVTWSDGFNSVTLFLRRQADGELRGTARHFTDARAVDPQTGRWLWERSATAPATLEAIPCT